MNRKKILNLILMMVFLMASLSLFACDNDYGLDFVKDKEKVGPQFLEGALVYVELGNTVVLNEYIEYVSDAEYSIVITDGKDFSEDFTNEIYWIPEIPGKYTIIYTVKGGKSKGTSRFELTIAAPEMTWEYTLQNMPYLFGETLNFEEYFSKMNIYAFSYFPWRMVMDSVEVDGVLIDLSEKTEYTFQSMSDHLFRFHIESEDGQKLEAREVISIKYIDTDFYNELTQRGITTHGELIVKRDELTLIAGQYNNGNPAYLNKDAGPHKLPYIAFNGNYGINSYVQVDFTGPNIPLVSFFRDDSFSESIFDMSSKGILFSPGLLDNNGQAISLSDSFSFYGPYMIYRYYDRDYLGDGMRGTAGNPYPGSMLYLMNSGENYRYRMICGFSNLEQSANSTYLTFECIIVNLDTREIVTKFTRKTYNINAIGKDIRDTNYDFDASFYSGNIVLYGNYGKTTTLDAVYDIITDKTIDQIYSQFGISDFKGDAPTIVLKGHEIDISKFVDTSAEGYIFFYKDDSGRMYTVSGDTVKFDESGAYTLYYSDGIRYCGTLSIYVGDYDRELMEWFEEHNIVASGLLESDDGSIILKGGKVSTPFPSTVSGINELSYIGYKGNYGANDFVVLEFTGKNLPMISFFNKKLTYNPCDGNFGFIVNPSSYSQNTGNKIDVHGPYKIFHIEGDGALTDSTSSSRLLQIKPTGNQPYPGSQASLSEDKRYALIVGFTSASRSNTILSYCIVDMDSNEVVVNIETPIQYQIQAYGPRYNHITDADFTGSIAVYGFYNNEITFDKLYPIQEDTNVRNILSGIFGMQFSEFKKNAPTKIYMGRTANVADFIDTEDNYVLYYINGNGTRVNITGSTFSIDEAGIVTLVYKQGNKMEAKLTLTVSDKLPKLLDGNLYGYKVPYDKQTGSAVLQSGNIGNGANYIGPNSNELIDQAYLVFEGEYSFNDYFVADFTGKNMPELAFFAQDYNESMYVQYGKKKGVLIASGVTMYNGALHSGILNGSTQVNVSGPYMANIGTAAATGNSGNLMSNFNAHFARANLVDGTHYRIIMGFSMVSEKIIQLNYCLINLDTMTIIEQSSQQSWGLFDNESFYSEKASSLKGSIIAYGKYGTETRLDKVYNIFENTSIAAILANFDLNNN
jgi:hypothetical protein